MRFFTVIFRFFFIFQSFPFLAFKSTMTLVSSAAKSAAEYLFGGEIFPTSTPPKFLEDNNIISNKVDNSNNNNNNNNNAIYNLDNNNNIYGFKDNKDMQLVFEEDEIHLGSNPGPPYTSNLLLLDKEQNKSFQANNGKKVPSDHTTSIQPNNNNINNNNNNNNEFSTTSNGNSIVGSVMNGDIVPGTLAYDPISKTLYVPKHISDALDIVDGSILPLPHDLLRQAVADGQIQVVGKNEEETNILSKVGRPTQTGYKSLIVLFHSRVAHL